MKLSVDKIMVFVQVDPLTFCQPEITSSVEDDSDSNGRKRKEEKTGGVIVKMVSLSKRRQRTTRK